MAGKKRKDGAFGSSQKPAKRGKAQHQPTEAELALVEIRKEKARVTARKKAEEKRKAEQAKNLMLDALVEEMKKEAKSGQDKKGRALRNHPSTSSSTKTGTAGQTHQHPPSSPVLSHAVISSHDKPVESTQISPAELPMPAFEVSSDDGAPSGTLLFSVSARTDTKHKAGRKAFKRSAEEAARQRGLTVVSSEWRPHRAGVEVKWTRPVALTDELSEDASSESESAEAPVDHSEQQTSASASHPDEEMCSNEVVGETPQAASVEHERSSTEDQQSAETAHETRDADRFIEFTQADLDALFEPEKGATHDSNDSWGAVSDEVTVLQAILQEPAVSDVKKARVLNQLREILAKADAVETAVCHASDDDDANEIDQLQ